MKTALLCRPPEGSDGHDERWPFSSKDLEIARKAYSVIVGDNPSQALRLDPVIRWQEFAWDAFGDTLRATGFDRYNPGHVTALQWLIDQACDGELTKK